MQNSNVNFEIISRSKITEKKNGPLIILESTSVTYVDTNYTVHKDKLDNLIITDENYKMTDDLHHYKCGIERKSRKQI